MRKSLYKTSLIGVLVALSHAVGAVEKRELSEKTPSRSGEQKRYQREETLEPHRLGTIAFYVYPFLREEERKKISDLIRIGLERSIFVEAKKYTQSLPSSKRSEKIPSPQYILGHLRFEGDPFLTSEERKRVKGLINQGFAHKYQEPLSKWTDDDPEEVEKLLKVHGSQKPFKEGKKLREEAKETLGQCWFSVRPFLSEEENEILSRTILKGFDRSLEKKGEVRK